MTRFARAKGSKSSNLKEPDDSTPWEVMKGQLLQAKKESEDNKNREVAENQRIENYNNFLKEQKVQKRKAVWCDFPETEKKSTNVQQHDGYKPIKTKNKSKKISNNQTDTTHNDQETLDNGNVTNIANKKIKKKSKTEKDADEPKQDFEPTQATFNNTNVNVSNKKKKNKSKTLNLESKQNIQGTDVDEVDMKNYEVKNKKAANQPTGGNAKNLQTNNKKKKDKRNKGDKPTRRKEINDRSFQIIINGKEVELIRFDGFPIMKKDFERLNELKTSMMKKGIPKTEVNRTIKLERRRAEKALARLKREVCYNCRKGGHNLSDCPDLRSNIPGVGAADGICFKCGSTEHRQFECKVQKDNEFRFASCFICKEQGHIARQCPDNPKGIYPNGGSCKLCGDVTHKRKDCPTVQNQKEVTSIKLQTLDAGNDIEDIGLQPKPVAQEGPKKPKKIKF